MKSSYGNEPVVRMTPRNQRGRHEEENKEGYSGSLSHDTPKSLEESSTPLDKRASFENFTSTFSFNEKLVQRLVEMGYIRKKILTCLIQMTEDEEPTDLPSVVNKLLQLEAQDGKLRKDLREKEDQLKERESQIFNLTGGFGYETYKRIHDLRALHEKNECIICLVNPRDHKTSCGCKVMCVSCNKKMKNKTCPCCQKTYK